MPSKLLGGLSGLFSGLAQGANLWLALKQAEQEREHEDTRRKQDLARADWQDFMQRNQLSMPQEQFQRFQQEPTSATLPVMGGGVGMASATPGATTPTGFLGQLNATRARQEPDLSRPETILQAARPQAIPEYGAVAQSPYNTGTMAALVAAMRPRVEPATPNLQLKGDPGTEAMVFDPVTGKLKPTGQMLPQAQRGLESIVPARSSAANAAEMLSAWQRMETEFISNPEGLAEVANLSAAGDVVGEIPLFGGLAETAIKKSVGKTLTPAGQRMLHNFQQFIAVAFPERGGANLTGNELRLYAPVFLPMPGEDESVRPQKRAAALQRVRNAAEKGGLDLFMEMAQRQGIVIPPELFPGGVETSAGAPSTSAQPGSGVPVTVEPNRPKFKYRKQP